MARTVNPERRAARRQQILDGASACFAEKGFHATSMQDICDAAGMSPGALYRYFSSKDDIIIAIVEEERRTDDEFVYQMLSSGDLFGSLREACEYVMECSKEPGYAELSAEVYAEILRNPKAREIYAEGYRNASRALSKTIKKAIDGGELDAAWQPDALAEVLLAIIGGLEARPAFARKVSARSMRSTVERLLTLLKQSC